MIKVILIKNPRYPAELKNIVRKIKDTTRQIIPGNVPSTSVDKYIGTSEKSNLIKGKTGNIGIFAMKPSIIEKAVNKELSVHFNILFLNMVF